MDPPVLRAVVQDHVETSGHGDKELVQLPVCVAASFRPAGHVIKIVDPLDFEGYVSIPFDKGQIAAPIGNLGKIDNSAKLNTHSMRSPPGT